MLLWQGNIENVEDIHLLDAKGLCWSLLRILYSGVCPVSYTTFVPGEVHVKNLGKAGE
jgi:hypothetical protein